jgi:EpsI family protein
MSRRLANVLIVLVIGLGSVFLLPHSSKSSPAGIAMTLPIFIGEWMGDDADVTPREREVLAKDTQFARKLYRDLAGDEIYVSIVLSGDDMTNSIHRPERCLPAQGWTLQRSERRTIPLRDGKSVAVTELHTARTLRDNKGHELTLKDLNYYWFVGAENITASHLQRTAYDLRDRILHGQDQRWAYITVTSIVTKGVKNPQRDEAQTAAMIEHFISQLAPKLQRPDGTQLL